MSHPLPGHEYGETTLSYDPICSHESSECVDELKPGWGLYSCNDCGHEWQASTIDASREEADTADASRNDMTA